MSEPLMKRLLDKCLPEPNSGCWLWTDACTSKGYGRINVDRRSTRAHRLSYELHVGPIPSGMFVCHRCDTPACINPAHLFVGSAADNSRDMKAKGRSHRQRITHCPQGHAYDENNTRWYRSWRYCRACHMVRGWRP